LPAWYWATGISPNAISTLRCVSWPLRPAEHSRSLSGHVAFQ
jgi:hypothetical protein